MGRTSRAVSQMAPGATWMLVFERKQQGTNEVGLRPESQPVNRIFRRYNELVAEIEDAKTRITLIADYGVVRDMLADLLSSEGGFDFAGAFGSIAQSTAAIEERPPDLVLLDPGMLDTSVIERVRDMKLRHSEVRVVLLSTSDNEETVLAAIDAGVEGYLLKDVSRGQLLEALRSVASGEYAFHSSVTAPILRRLAKTQSASGNFSSRHDLQALSAREKEIACLVAQGLTNREVAEAAFVSVNTVKTHLRRIYRRIGISSRRQLRQGYRLPTVTSTVA